MNVKPEIYIALDLATGDDLMQVVAHTGGDLTVTPRQSPHVSSGTSAQLIAAGKDVALVLGPILAFYLGKGRTVTVRNGPEEVKLSGFSAREAVELIRVLKGDPPDTVGAPDARPDLVPDPEPPAVEG